MSMVPNTMACMASCERAVDVLGAGTRASVNGTAWFSRVQNANGMPIASSSRSRITSWPAAGRRVSSVIQVEENAEFIRDVSRCEQPSLDILDTLFDVRCEFAAFQLLADRMGTPRNGDRCHHVCIMITERAYHVRYRFYTRS